jgi:hypothetical protein
MSPILGIWASAQQGVNTAGDFESISTVTVGAGGSSSISFTSIPATYSHLQVRVFARTNRADTLDYLQFNFNSDTASNYAYHFLEGGGSSIGPSSSVTQPNVRHIYLPGANNLANVFGGFVTDILDYSNTSKNKTTRHLGAFDANGSGTCVVGSGLWMSTAAISSIQITPISGNSFVQYSSFALYGIKG